MSCLLPLSVMCLLTFVTLVPLIKCRCKTLHVRYHRSENGQAIAMAEKQTHNKNASVHSTLTSDNLEDEISTTRRKLR